MNRRIRWAVMSAAASAFFICGNILAGDLEPPGPSSESSSAMYTLEDIYNRLNEGTEGAKREGGFTEPGSGPTSGTKYTLDQIMVKAPTRDDTDGAGPADVLFGKTFWGLTGGGWGEMPGTMTDRDGDNPSTAQTATDGVNYFTAPEGYYDGDDRVSATDAQLEGLDADLTSENVKSGVTIFGVSGDPNVVDTSSGDAAADDIKQGTTAWVDGQEISGTSIAQMYSYGEQCNVSPACALNTRCVKCDGPDCDDLIENWDEAYENHYRCLRFIEDNPLDGPLGAWDLMGGDVEVSSNRLFLFNGSTTLEIMP